MKKSPPPKMPPAPPLRSRSPHLTRDSAPEEVPTRGSGPTPALRRLSVALPAASSAPVPLPTDEVAHQMHLVDQAVAALDRLVSALPERPPLPAGELRRMQERWRPPSPAFCQTVARAIDQHPEVFAPLPFSGTEVRGQIDLGDRFGDLLDRLDRYLPQLAELVVRLRGEVTESCAAALSQAEAGLLRPFLPTEKQRLIRQVTAGVHRLVLEQVDPSVDELLDEMIISEPVPYGADARSKAHAHPTCSESELLGLEAMVARSEEELADALLRKLSRRAPQNARPRKPN